MKHLKELIDNNEFSKLFKDVLNLSFESDFGEFSVNKYEITLIQHFDNGLNVSYTLSLPEFYIFRSISIYGIEKSYLKSEDIKVIEWLLNNDYSLEIKDMKL